MPSRGRRRSASGCRSVPRSSRCCGASSSSPTRPAASWTATGRRGSSSGSRGGPAIPATLLTAERIFGNSEFFLGRFTSARRHLERSLALYDPAEHHGLALDYAYDQRVVARDILAATLFALGYPDQAKIQNRQAVAEAEALHHGASLAHALDFACILDQLGDDTARVLSSGAAMRRLAEVQAVPYWSSRTIVLEGWATAREGSPDAGAATILSALDALRAIGVRAFRPYHLALLADVKARAGRYGEALAHVDDGLREVNETGERWFEAELHRLRGELISRLGGDPSAVEVRVADRP